MYDCEKNYQLLELSAVLNLLSQQASLELTKEAAINLRPFSDIETVKHELEKTDEAVILSAKYASPSFGKATNPYSLLTRCEVGAVLTMAELLAVLDSLRVIRKVKEWQINISDHKIVKLLDLFEGLIPNKYLEDLISTSIKNEDEMYDNASTELAEIRRKIRRESAKIKDKLDSVVKNHSKAKYLQEAIVTQRDGRYVVPVKAEYKNEIPGILHDTSSSGATLFIEPMSVVESNNEIRVLQTREKEEIDRILAELSMKVSDFAKPIKASYSALVELDLIFAKASLAYKMRGIMPKINSEGRVILNNARHPLIEKSKVVPISLTLGVDFDTLVITGPNTGGKTVTLKTVGLLTIMAMCGLLIPADTNSEISFFDRILVDIGDKQSIEQSLSTFSSHMVNIINIIEESKNNSLVLLDELGGGTDPVEGAALAKAIMIKLAQNSAKTIATTHYPELKGYAVDAYRVENASCEFDIKSLKPTYRLLIGVPGKSNAFKISLKLGIDKDIVELANTFVTDENRQIDNITSALEAARQEAETERIKAKIAREEADKLRLNAEKSLNEAKQTYESMMEKAKNDASYIIDNARYKSNSLLTSLEEMKKQFSAENASKLYNAAKSITNQTLVSVEKESDPIINRDSENYILPRPLKIGDSVLLFDINKHATVEQISSNEKRIYVSMGNIKTWTEIVNVRLVEEKTKPNKPAGTRRITGIKSKAERDIKYEFDMRGMTTDEGIIELDRYIDGAVLAGITSVTIIHGKGTGALRNAVHSFLKSNKNIITFRLGVFGEGESGVTIAEIKT